MRKILKCPICGKEYLPAPMHSYKIGSVTNWAYVCSYTCMRKYESEYGMKDWKYIKYRKGKKKGKKKDA